MRITCPACESMYDVNDSLITTSGREVRCSACGATWRAFPPAETDPPAEAAPPPVQPPVAPKPDAAPIEAPRSPAPPVAQKAAPAAQSFSGRGGEEDALARPTSAPPPVAPPSGSDSAYPAFAVEQEAPQPPVTSEIKAPEPAESAERARKDAIGVSSAAMAQSIETAPERRGGGAFLAGFSIVTIAAVAMVALYVKHEDVTRAAPQLAEPIERYVTLVDEARLRVADFADQMRAE